MQEGVLLKQRPVHKSLRKQYLMANAFYSVAQFPLSNCTVCPADKLQLNTLHHIIQWQSTPSLLGEKGRILKKKNQGLRRNGEKEEIANV